MKFHYFAAFTLILVGALLLIDNLGLTQINFGKLIATWWPLILVGVGVGMLVNRKG